MKSKKMKLTTKNKMLNNGTKMHRSITKTKNKSHEPNKIK